MRISRRSVLKAAVLSPIATAFPSTRADVVTVATRHSDVAIYGGTPGGIAAALCAARCGHSVLILEPYSWVGGLMTNGLTHTDIHSFESLSGTNLDLARRVEAHYVKTYGKDSPQHRDCMRGIQAENKVNRRAFEQMLAEQPKIRVLTKCRLAKVDVWTFQTPASQSTRITAATFTLGDGKTITVEAKVFIDATYEGDLLAAANVPFHVGREGKDKYGESLAPDVEDKQLQAYNFRLSMTNVAENRVMPVAPPGYRREDYLDLLPLLGTPGVKKIFGTGPGSIYKAQVPQLPNGKFDINDVSHGAVRLSLPGHNDAWPTGDWEARKKIFDEHLRHNVGMLYFLQNDDAVPAAFRDEARQYGLCKDELVENNHLPEQLYVREARRMIGKHVYTQNDTAYAPGDARAKLHRDSIAISDYGHNCHGTSHTGPMIGGKHAGEFYGPVAPYQIPYGVIVPKMVTNLLVPVAASSSHVGFCALRLEPTWMSLGDAAGFAAHLVIAGNLDVQSVPVAKLQSLIHGIGGATIYVTDVLPGHADFAAVQWWGTAGGLHGLEPSPAKPGQRGKQIIGQYYEATPGHEVQLEKTLDDATKTRWLALAGELKLDVEKLKPAATRGEFIRRAHAGATTPR